MKRFLPHPVCGFTYSHNQNVNFLSKTESRTTKRRDEQTMNVYLYFCYTCAVLAVCTAAAGVVDFFIHKNKKPGKHEKKAYDKG